MELRISERYLDTEAELKDDFGHVLGRRGPIKRLRLGLESENYKRDLFGAGIGITLRTKPYEAASELNTSGGVTVSVEVWARVWSYAVEVEVELKSPLMYTNERQIVKAYIAKF